MKYKELKQFLSEYENSEVPSKYIDENTNVQVVIFNDKHGFIDQDATSVLALVNVAMVTHDHTLVLTVEL